MEYKRPYVASYAALTPGLNDSYGELFTGYSLPAGRIGAPTNPQTANQIAEVTNMLNQGMKTVEMGALGPKEFETIPQQHFKEMQQLSDLTGSEITVHAPLVDPSGFTEQGWSETARRQAEMQLSDVMAKSHELSKNGNVPVTIHASGIPAWEFQESLPKEEKGKYMMVAVNQETGQLIPIKREERFYPEGKKIWKVEEELETINHSEWSNKIASAEHFKKSADEILDHTLNQIAPILLKEKSGEKLSEHEAYLKENLTYQVQQADRFLEHVNASLRSDYHLAYKYDKNMHKNEKIKEFIEASAEPYKEYAAIREKIGEKQHRGIRPEAEEWIALAKAGQMAASSLSSGLMVTTPELYVPVEEFAVKHAAQTLGNVAFKAFKDYGDKAPVIAIENVFPEHAFSRADSMRDLVEASKNQFIAKVREAKGISHDEAAKIADKLIGVTWDVGHINLLRKAGYSEKEIVEESKKISPYVKKVHMTDNFGFNDTHLPPGMGNVPIKKIMEEMEKAGFSGKTIMEAGGFVQHFKVSPHPYILEAMGSPMYSGASSPVWSQAKGMYGAYFGGYGPILPEQHFSIYGTAFSGLPTELGGQIPGRQSRMSGTPMD